MSDYVWLCKYGSHYVTETYGMVIQTTEFDGVERFFLEQKKNMVILMMPNFKDWNI